MNHQIFKMALVAFVLFFIGTSIALAGTPATPVCSLPPLSQQATNTFCEIIVDNFPFSYLKATIFNAPSGFSVTNGNYFAWCVDADTSIEPGPTYKPIAYFSTDPLPPSLPQTNWNYINYIINHKQGNSTDIQFAIWHYVGGPIPAHELEFYPPTATFSNIVADALANGGSFVPGPGQVVAVILDLGPNIQMNIIEVVCTVIPRNPLGILTHPTSTTVQAGATAQFTVTAEGIPPLYYQWRKEGLNIAGETNTTLTLNAVTFFDPGSYSVTVWNSAGSVTSSPAQLTVFSAMTLLPTLRVPTEHDTKPISSFECNPPNVANLLKYANGGFTTPLIAPFDPGRMTIVLTHGWNSNPDEWAKDMATKISGRFSGPTPNIVAWNWLCAAATGCKLNQAAEQTGNQGRALGEALSFFLAPMGQSYHERIHFIGHSLGTLVNSSAANYLHSHGFSPTNTHVTLFDEAEVGTDFRCRDFFGALHPFWDPLKRRPHYLQPLPKNSAWVDNYVSFAGLLHREARNVILTTGIPANSGGIFSWIADAISFHSYPQAWYGQTVVDPASAQMGYHWSFEEGGFEGAPTNGVVYLQSGSQLNPMANYEAGESYLKQRIDKYRLSLFQFSMRTVSFVGQASGSVSGQVLSSGLEVWDRVIDLRTSGGGGSFTPSSGSNFTNTPAFAWIPLSVPSNAVSVSFDFMLQGDSQSDSFAVSLNGTNILALAFDASLTNLTHNSGLIDVRTYAGQQVELFLGLVGGTSVDASVTVSNFQFYILSTPALQAQLAGDELITSWPLSASDYILETTSLLAETNSWTAVTNVSAIVDFQNTVTNAATDSSKFYRLRKP